MPDTRPVNAGFVSPYVPDDAAAMQRISPLTKLYLAMQAQGQPAPAANLPVAQNAGPSGRSLGLQLNNLLARYGGM